MTKTSQIPLVAYYGEQIDNFTFYRVLKALFTSPRYKALSAEAKILYGLLLDRAALSTRNGWKDERGRIFIYYTVKEIMAEIGCSKQKAIRLLDELEYRADLIRRVKQGLGKPNRIHPILSGWDAIDILYVKSYN